MIFAEIGLMHPFGNRYLPVCRAIDHDLTVMPEVLGFGYASFPI